MPRDALTFFSRSAAAMVLIGDSERTPLQIHELLVALYGLTPAEARVATLLLGGTRVEEIADRLQITGNTVRTHVKRALSKLDARTQSDLVRVLMSGPAQLR